MIQFPRRGADGRLYSQKEIEDAFKANIVTEIEKRLGAIETHTCLEKKCIGLLKRQAGYLLIAKPVSLKRIKNWCDRFCSSCSSCESRVKELKKEVLNAFNYEGYRTRHLVCHAERLNVKTCCYCNMNYTLLVEEKNARSIDVKALMQFDHFYDKIKYPHLSMSMYNLIPSCATCNQGKPRSGDLPIFFNPYHSSLFEMYKFRVKDPLQLYLAIAHPEKIEVECRSQTTEDISACDNSFHLSAKYSVHKDIVKEVFDKAQQFPYYVNFNNFKFLKEGASYPLRLLLGVYPDEKDFDKRPMSKFVTDIWEQACLFFMKPKIRR